MVDDDYDNNEQPLVGAKRKRLNTIAKTFTLPMDVITTLSWFSEKLGMKKSHLVVGCVLDIEKIQLEELFKEMKELRESVEDQLRQCESVPL